MIDPKRKKILTALLRSKRLGGGVLWEPYPSYHNGPFSPLLVLRDFTARGADQYRCYPTSTRLLTFSLSFLCNIICYLISVFAFSLVTLSGATTEGKKERKEERKKEGTTTLKIYVHVYIYIYGCTQTHTRSQSTKIHGKVFLNLQRPEVFTFTDTNPGRHKICNVLSSSI